MGLTPEQEAKLKDIEENGGKSLTPAQKATILKFGTINIKADKPKAPDTVSLPEGPEVKPKMRTLPKIGQEK